MFKFPLLLASSGLFAGGLNGLESILRTLAKPGATIDLQPEGVATANAVRFDVIDGRLDDSYTIQIQRIQRRRATLSLTVQPFGYWPTDIILASVASVALPGVVAIPGGSIIGDVPGLARLIVQPSSASSFPAGTWMTDMVAWGLAGAASFSAILNGGSWTSAITASMVGNKYALGSQSLELFPSPTQGGWTQMAAYNIASVLEPAYRGRYRAFLYARTAEPSTFPWKVSLDLMGGLQTNRALASVMPVATIPADGIGSVISASPAYVILDMGEFTSPQTGSGTDQTVQLRLWGAPATSNLGIASPWLSIGGVYLLPLDGPEGILPRGLSQPTNISPSVGKFVIDGYTRTALVAAPAADLATPMTPLGNALAYYVGDMPKVIASTIRLDLLAGARKNASGATAPVAHANLQYASVSLTYRPRFTFLRAI